MRDILDFEYNGACSRSSIVPFVHGPKRSMGHFLRAEKGNFLIRGSRRPMGMAPAPVESCQSLSNRCPWGRLGSVLYTCTRLHRIRRRFKHFWSISLSRPLGLAIFWPLFAFKLSGSTRPPHRRRMRYRRLPTTRPTPRDRHEPICRRKKCAIWTRWRPVPVKYAITRGPPVVAVAVSLDPILPHR